MKNLNWITVVFVVLKLIGTIDWSWWAVFSPTLIGLTINIMAAILVFLSGKLR